MDVFTMTLPLIGRYARLAEMSNNGTNEYFPLLSFN